MVSFKNFVQSSTTGSGQSNLTEAKSKADRYSFAAGEYSFSAINFDFIISASKAVKKIYSTYDREDGEEPIRWEPTRFNDEAISVSIRTEVPFDEEEFERTSDGKKSYTWIKESEQMELTIEKMTKKINSMDSNIKVDYIKYDNSNDWGVNIDKGFMKCLFFVAIIPK